MQKAGTPIFGSSQSGGWEGLSNVFLDRVT